MKGHEPVKREEDNTAKSEEGGSVRYRRCTRIEQEETQMGQISELKERQFYESGAPSGKILAMGAGRATRQSDKVRNTNIAKTSGRRKGTERGWLST
jgi:hypothetical protein